jgi:hypothetical protein
VVGQVEARSPLAAQLANLLALGAGQLIGAAAFLGCDLADELAQRLRGQTEISCNMGSRAVGFNTTRVAGSSSPTGTSSLLA